MSDVEMAVLVAGELSILAALAAGVWVGLAVVVRGGAVTVSALERAVLGRLGVAAAACNSREPACGECSQHFLQSIKGRNMHLNQAGCCCMLRAGLNVYVTSSRAVRLTCRPRTPAAAATCPSSSAATSAYSVGCRAHAGAISMQDCLKRAVMQCSSNG